MVTINDVARRAGVSNSTVSYVLSGRRSISAATRRRVERAITDLGYRPNANAQALAGRRGSALGLVAPLRADNNVPVVMQFVAAVATAAREREHDVLLVTEQEGEEGVRRVSQTSLVDAVLVMDVEADDARIPMLRELGRPCVLIGVPDEPAGLSCVDLDTRQAAALAVDHLYSLGHRRIAMLGSPPAVYDRRSTYALRFADGYRHAMGRRDLRAAWHPVDQTYDAVQAVLKQVFADDARTTGLVVHNEGVLNMILSVLERMGLEVPHRVSIVVLSPTNMAVGQHVELTGIDVAAAEVGATAVEMVLRQLDGGSGGETRLVNPVLEQRASTTQPPDLVAP